MHHGARAPVSLKSYTDLHELKLLLYCEKWFISSCFVTMPTVFLPNRAQGNMATTALFAVATIFDKELAHPLFLIY